MTFSTLASPLCPLCLGGSILLIVAPALAQTDFAARLSDAAAAIEYWDVTAQLQSGHRFFARFLVTNEGPGSRTAAAVGHLILPGGDVVPIKYGRLREKWTLSADRRRLEIASAVLDLGRPVSRIEVDSDKRGIKVHLELARDSPPIAISPIPGLYQVEVQPPRAVRGTIWLRGMPAPIAVEGTVALTHTWMEQSELELLEQRAELIARVAEADLYVTHITLADGRRGAAVVLSRNGDAARPNVFQQSDDVTVTVGEARTTPGDPRYPVPEQWEVRHASGLRIGARLRREWLRWDPLEIIPQPFRFILSFQGQPQRMWADAGVELALPGSADAAARSTTGTGIATVSFARSVPSR